MRQGKKPSSRGVLRRRWRSMLEDGSLARLRSEGRLAALYVLYAADWTTCEVRLSFHSAAKRMGTQVTSIRRGVRQLVEAGLMSVVERPGGAGKTLYVLSERAQGVRAQGVSEPVSACARSLTRAVSKADTSGVQGAHALCSTRAQPVSTARTLCARNTVLSSGRPVSTTGSSVEVTPVSGLEPDTACPEDGSDTIRQEGAA